MAVTLTNQAKHLIAVPLNDGGSVYLAPGETSAALDESQLSGNERLARLLREGLVSTAAPGSGAEAGAADEGEGEGEKPAAAAEPAAGPTTKGATPHAAKSDTTK